MNIEDFCQKVFYDLVKISASDERPHRKELKQSIENAVINLKTEFARLTNQYENLIIKSTDTAKENVDLKRELEYRKIAEGEDKERIDHIVSCMKKAAEK